MRHSFLELHLAVLRSLRERRDDLGLSGTDAAKLINERLRIANDRLSKDMLGKIERKETPLSLQRFLAICDAYNENPARLIDPGAAGPPAEFVPLIRDSYVRRLLARALERDDRDRIFLFLSLQLRLYLENL